MCFMIVLQVGQGFAGCMKNLSVTQGGVTTLYSLGNPADFQDEETFKVLKNISIQWDAD